MKNKPTRIYLSLLEKNLARSRFQEKDRKLMVQQLSIIPKLPIQEENT